jgi:hypothetical protein
MHRKKIGYINVDSGQIFIADPVNLNHWRPGDYEYGKDTNNSYAQVSILSGKDNCGEIEDGVVVSNFGGDGSYPVYAFIDDEGIITKIEIDFTCQDS